MLYVRFTTEALITEVRSLRERTGWPARTDGPWTLLDRLERAERELRIRGLDPDAIDESASSAPGDAPRPPVT